MKHQVLNDAIEKFLRENNHGENNTISGPDIIEALGDENGEICGYSENQIKSHLPHFNRNPESKIFCKGQRMGFYYKAHDPCDDEDLSEECEEEEEEESKGTRQKKREIESYSYNAVSKHMQNLFSRALIIICHELRNKVRHSNPDLVALHLSQYEEKLKDVPLETIQVKKSVREIWEALSSFSGYLQRSERFTALFVIGSQDFNKEKNEPRYKALNKQFGIGFYFLVFKDQARYDAYLRGEIKDVNPAEVTLELLHHPDHKPLMDSLFIEKKLKLLSKLGFESMQDLIHYLQKQ